MRAVLIACLACVACATASPGSGGGDDGGGDDDPGVDARPSDGASELQLDLTSTGPGSVAVVPPGTPCGAGCSRYAASTSVTVTATPTSSLVTSWTGPCATTAAGQPCTFELSASTTVHVTFTAVTASNFSYTGAAQSYVVPAGATTLSIVADGASGGFAETTAGGFGAHVDATVPITAGTTLVIVVGGQPTPAPHGSDGCGGSGGGGSFVANGTTALAVAGGGGGAGTFNTAQTGGNASLTGDGGSSSTTAGGTGGGGGAGYLVPYNGGGGGGITGDGTDGAPNTKGRSLSNGAAGGASANLEACGAIPAVFGGGGGGGRDFGGGGGGYSGGAAQSNSGAKSGGGGSYGLGTPTFTLRTTHGNGSITITPH